MKNYEKLNENPKNVLKKNPKKIIKNLKNQNLTKITQVGIEPTTFQLPYDMNYGVNRT
jgi:hypothetical protein